LKWSRQDDLEAKPATDWQLSPGRLPLTGSEAKQRLPLVKGRKKNTIVMITIADHDHDENDDESIGLKANYDWKKSNATDDELAFVCFTFKKQENGSTFQSILIREKWSDRRTKWSQLSSKMAFGTAISQSTVTNRINSY
jgi:hypothetical protein